LFAGRDYEEGEFIGVYYARPAAGQSQHKRKKNEHFCMQANGGKLYLADANELFLGFHFANDPYFKSGSDSDSDSDCETEENLEKVNIVIKPNLHVETIRHIKKGDEIFWNYCLGDVK
jgi:hypothetical protein